MWSVIGREGLIEVISGSLKLVNSFAHRHRFLQIVYFEQGDRQVQQPSEKTNQL